MELFETTLLSGKTQPIRYEQVQLAYQKVKSNGGSGGVDKIEILDYEVDKVKRLYKLWNRMASGSYHPQAVRSVEIPKSDGSKRVLGIPTIDDRIAQQVVKDVLEPRLEAIFHSDSYGYRPRRSAHDALAQCRSRCFKQPYVIDLDIKGFFDNIHHDLLLCILSTYVSENWILLYVKRWLEAPIQTKTGAVQARVKGTPQGGVISPLLANLFLHVVFDTWISEQIPSVSWERYADDIIIHCWGQQQAEDVLLRVKLRFSEMGLTAHEQKTKIVYCKTANRKGTYPTVSFDFLGYCFKPRECLTKQGTLFLGFTPSISTKACKYIREDIRKMGISRLTHLDLPSIAQLLAAKTRGWLLYYGKFTMSGIGNLFQYWLNERLGTWVKNKYKTCKGSITKAMIKLKEIYKDFPNLFVHWQYGYRP